MSPLCPRAGWSRGPKAFEAPLPRPNKKHAAVERDLLLHQHLSLEAVRPWPEWLPSSRRPKRLPPPDCSYVDRSWTEDQTAWPERSEERRVGKEERLRGEQCDEKE